MYERGTRVKYNGERYYIIDGPTNSIDGAKYTLSTVPPPIKVLESELSPDNSEE